MLVLERMEVNNFVSGATRDKVASHSRFKINIKHPLRLRLDIMFKNVIVYGFA